MLANGRVRQVFVSPWTHAVLLAVATLAAWLRTALPESPILWDHAYFTYLGQEVLRGESIYANTFYTYPPLGPLLSAASMWLGRAFELPTYLAPRYLAAPVGAASVVVLYLFTRRATGSAWSGLLAGVALAGFGILGASVRSTLEPKVLLIFFTPLAALALQRRRWFAAGLAAGGAATCWQVGLLIALTSLATALHGGRAGCSKRVGGLAVGFALALLPTALYLSVTDGWWDFWQRSVVIPVSSQLGTAGLDPAHWLQVMWIPFPNERFFFGAAGSGFLWFAIASLREGAHPAARAWADPRWGALPLLTLGWVAFNSLEFNGAPDLLPFLPIVAFWCGWLAQRVVKVGVAIPRVAARSGHSRAFSNVVHASLLGIAVTYAFADPRNGQARLVELPAMNPRGFRTLTEEVALVRRIIEPAGSDGAVVALSAEEVYALSERRSPVRVLRLAESVVPFLPLVGLHGCPDLVRQTLGQNPAVVVIGLWHRSGDCERRMARGLRARGYVWSELKTRRSTWHVYWPAAYPGTPPGRVRSIAPSGPPKPADP